MEKDKQPNESLTTQSCIQPIRVTTNNETKYVFDDEEIMKEMKSYHLDKNLVIDPEVLLEAEKFLTEAKKSAFEGGGGVLMNMGITDREIDSTFNTCCGAPGPDSISAKLIDQCHRGSMHKCLSVIWNKAWESNMFPSVWKITGLCYQSLKRKIIMSARHTELSHSLTFLANVSKRSLPVE